MHRPNEHYTDLNQFEEITQTGTWRLDKRNFTIHFSPFLQRLFQRESMLWSEYSDMLPMQYRPMLNLYSEDIALPFRLAHNGQTHWIRRHVMEDTDQYRIGSLTLVKEPTHLPIDDSIELIADYFETLFRALPVGVSICDSSGTIIEANQANLDLFKVVDKNELLGYNVIKHSALPDELKERLQNEDDYISYTYTFNYEELKGHYQTYGEGEMTLMCRVQRMYNRKGRPIGYIVINLDLSELRKKTLELEKSLIKAQESDRLKTSFLANIQHEVRTPLNAIVGFSELFVNLRKEGQIENEEMDNCVRLIKENEELLLNVLGNVLQLSQLETGIIHYNRVPLEVNDLLTHLHKRWASHCKEGVTMQLDLSSTPVPIQGDRALLSQVFSNLISNAIKFTKEGSITLSSRQLPTGQARIEVTDTGCGIPPEKMDKVFDRFIKVDDFIPGSGIGLSICRNIIKMAGGKIGVQANTPKGTLFWVEL